MKLVRAHTNGTAIQAPTISSKKALLTCVLLARAAPKNAPTVQFERLTGNRNNVRISSIKTDTKIAENRAVIGGLLGISFPSIELDMLLPANKNPTNTPASVRNRARL